jgi:hypothetical protein
MVIAFPIAYPLGKILDFVLGHTETALPREQLQQFVSLHGEGEGFARYESFRGFPHGGPKTRSFLVWTCARGMHENAWFQVAPTFPCLFGPCGLPLTGGLIRHCTIHQCHAWCLTQPTVQGTGHSPSSNCTEPLEHQNHLNYGTETPRKVMHCMYFGSCPSFAFQLCNRI